MSRRDSVRKRKTEHLELCREHPVEFQHKTTWLEYVELVHQAVPSFSPDDVDLSVEMIGRTLSAPFIIGAMTGGTSAARDINRKLAQVATDKGVGLALGSQRLMWENPSVADTYRVRDIAPDILLLGNIGLSQAVAMKPDEVVALLTGVGADGMCVHLNTAMEMFQEGGDAPAGKAYLTLGRLSTALGERLIVKETGCGLSRETAVRLAKVGLRTVDVVGAGGTSWVRVENLRRGAAPVGLAAFEEWGIPTAASLIEIRGLKLRAIASGGLRTGIDLAKAIALGAHVGSAALPVLRALYKGGPEGVAQWIDSVVAGLRTAMVLTGCRDLKTLRRAPIVVSGPLLEWTTQRQLWRTTRERRR